MADLIAEHLSKEYPAADGPLRVLRGASLELSAGENLAVLGPSGAGKSTLLHVLGGLDPPTSGSVKLRGVNPYDLPPEELARYRNGNVGFVFQDHHLLPQLTALENVLVPVLARGHVERANTERAIGLLDAVGLANRRTHRPGQLSGGERQRVAVARALIMKPILVLADEPTGSLDEASAKTVGKLLCDLPRQEGAILVCVTHNDALARQFDQRVWLNDGQLSDERQFQASV